MRDHRPTATDELIQASKLKQIQEHAKAILLINRQLQDILPKGLKTQVRAANVRGGNLVLEAASAALKMKVDYERLHILTQLRQNGFGHLISIEVRVNPELYRQSKITSEDARAQILAHRSLNMPLMRCSRLPIKLLIKSKTLTELSAFSESKSERRLNRLHSPNCV